MLQSLPISQVYKSHVFQSQRLKPISLDENFMDLKIRKLN